MNKFLLLNLKLLEVKSTSRVQRILKMIKLILECIKLQNLCH